MKEVVILTEEPTGKELFGSIMRKVGFGGRVTVLTHSGIGELRKSVSIKIAAHPNPQARFLIFFDQDNQDCRARKREFQALVPVDHAPRVRICVACREIESWLISQPAALKRAGVLKKEFSSALRRRNPDHIEDPKSELLRHAHPLGQFAIMRKFAPEVEIASDKSPSFKHAMSVVRWAMA